VNIATSPNYPRTGLKSPFAQPSITHAQKHMHSQFRGNNSSPPPNKPPKPEWLKKVAIVGALMGGSLTTYGVVNNISSKSATPPPQVQTENTSAQPSHSSPFQNKILSNRVIQDNRTLNAEFTGSKHIPLATCSADGYDVAGRFYIIWEKDLLTTSSEDRESQLKLILSKLPQEKILPQWKEPGVYLVASQKPEGVITYAKDIIEAYQNHLIDTVIQPELSKRFNDLFGNKKLVDIESNLQNLLFEFENHTGSNPIKTFMNDEGLTPTFMGFDKLQVGSKHFRVEKVVTTQMEVHPVMPMPMPLENSSKLEKDKSNPAVGEKPGEPTLADPIPPPPSMPEPIPDPIPNLPK
jgi:hypothetical protein